MMDWQFAPTDNNTVILCKYIGNEENVTIPKEVYGDPVTTMADNAFSGCNIKSITFPGAIPIISRGAFLDCTQLQRVNFSKCVWIIKGGAFSGCISLDNVVLPDTIRSIYEHTFFNCHGLSTIRIPKSVNAIYEGAFGHCHSLTDLEIPDSVSFIQKGAFIDCPNVNIHYKGKHYCYEDINSLYAAARGSRRYTLSRLSSSVISALAKKHSDVSKWFAYNFPHGATCVEEVLLANEEV